MKRAGDTALCRKVPNGQSVGMGILGRMERAVGEGKGKVEVGWETQDDTVGCLNVDIWLMF